jgi:hypothetical protein
LSLPKLGISLKAKRSLIAEFANTRRDVRVYHLLIGLLLLALSPLIFKSVFPKPKTEEKPKPVKVTETQPTINLVQTNPVVTSNSANSRTNNIWKNLLGKTSSPNNWKVSPCQGNTPTLCVTSQGKNLGTVEMTTYSLSQQPNFPKMLLTAGIDPNSKPEYANTDYQSKVSAALEIWTAQYYAKILNDRQVTVQNSNATFSAYPPQKIPFGKLQGIRYGFAEIKNEGGVIEQHFGYVAFDGKSLYNITTAFDPNAITGKFVQLENMAVFEPYLSATIADLKLP